MNWKTTGILKTVTLWESETSSPSVRMKLLYAPQFFGVARRLIKKEFTTSL